MGVELKRAKLIDTSTGEVIYDLHALRGDRNKRHSQDGAKRKLKQSIFGGRSPLTPGISAEYHNGPWPYWCQHTGDTWTCERCNRGVERADGKTIPVATDAQRRAAIPRDDIQWHYAGRHVWFGRDTQGRDFTMDVNTGKVERAFSLNAKRDALKLAEEYGMSAASRKTGISRNTLKTWRSRGI